MPARFTGTVWEYLATRIRIEENGCWTWLGAKSRGGYGNMDWKGSGVPNTTVVHRIVWFWTHGKFPPAGLQLDHLCRNRACCNPDHLEPVTQLENYRRGIGNPAKHKTHCKYGHPFDQQNTRMSGTGQGRQRVCHTCKKTAGRKYAKRRRARLAAP